MPPDMQSAGVQDVLNSYYMTGQTSGLYTFGAVGYSQAGANPVAQFVGSFRWSIGSSMGPTHVQADGKYDLVQGLLVFIVAP